MKNNFDPHSPYGTIRHKNIWSYILLLFPNLFFIPLFRKIVTYFSLPYCKNISFEPGFRFYYGDNIKAENVSLGNTFIMDYDKVIIGTGTVISKDNKLITATHGLENRHKLIKKPIVIGSNVWITNNCIILSGVRIGDNTVIGAGSVVTHNIPPNCLAAGNPAKIIKRFTMQHK